jgi:hypothetical protein
MEIALRILSVCRSRGWRRSGKRWPWTTLGEFCAAVRLRGGQSRVPRPYRARRAVSSAGSGPRGSCASSVLLLYTLCSLAVSRALTPSLDALISCFFCLGIYIICICICICHRLSACLAQCVIFEWCSGGGRSGAKGKADHLYAYMCKGDLACKRDLVLIWCQVRNRSFVRIYVRICMSF